MCWHAPGGVWMHLEVWDFIFYCVHGDSTLIIWLVWLASLLWDFLFLSYETGITGGLPHLASIYVGSRDQTQVLTLSGQLFSPWAASQPPMEFFLWGSCIFFSNHRCSHCVYQHSHLREPCWIWRQMDWYWGKPWEKRIQYQVHFKFNYCLFPGWVELWKTSSGPIHSHQLATFWHAANDNVALGFSPLVTMKRSNWNVIAWW